MKRVCTILGITIFILGSITFYKISSHYKIFELPDDRTDVLDYCTDTVIEFIFITVKHLDTVYICDTYDGQEICPNPL